MIGVFVTFRDREPFDNLFIRGNDWDKIKEKLKQRFEKKAAVFSDRVDYFNWMTIDSDFAQNYDYDAEISVHYVDAVGGGCARSYNYKIDFEIVHEQL